MKSILSQAAADEAADPRTQRNRSRWQEKPALRHVYHDLYGRMAAHCVPGRTLEIGGGSGNFKEYRSDVLSSDISYAPWLDIVADAQRLPLAASSCANIVMFDVLHHVEYPRLFFAEAMRVLAPGGRIVMVEPAITFASWPFYRFIHPEPVSMDEDPLAEGTPTPRDAFAGNQAIPTLLAVKHRERFNAAFPALRMHKVEWLSLFAYPLTGGFQRWAAIPASWVPGFLHFESLVAPSLGRFLAFRMLVVIAREA